jgi:hypothetical protein
MSIFQKIKKIDIFSKFLFLLILLVTIYITFLYIKDLRQKNATEGLTEVSSNKRLSINDYFFENYQANRLSNDMKLYLKINEDISQEELKKIEFRIIPKQEIEVNLIAEKLIEIKFKEKSPSDLRENVLIVLDSGKQLFRVIYKNLSEESSKADEIFIKRTE